MKEENCGENGGGVASLKVPLFAFIQWRHLSPLLQDRFSGDLLSLQESEPKACHRVRVNFCLSDGDDVYLPVHQPVEWCFHTPEEEIRCVPLNFTLFSNLFF